MWGAKKESRAKRPAFLLYINKGATRWTKSNVRDNTYDDVMNKTRANRKVYCVITDAFGNQIVTDTVTLTVKS